MLRVRSHLVVLDGQVGAPRASLVRNLHEVSAHQRPSDIHVMPSLVLVWLGHQLYFEAFHNSQNLSADVGSFGKGAS
jgi:hypothetical protein